jgi:chemotaxis protein MotB
VAEDSAGVHGQAPLIIKKKKVDGHGGHHGGAWKVAYADMVTALMALFIVLWIMNSSEEIKQSVAHHFSPEAVGFKDGGMPSLQQGAGSGNQLSILEDAPARGADSKAAEQRMLAKATEIRNAIDKLPSFDRYREQFEVSVTPEGLRINLLESESTPLFQRGGTELNVEAVEILTTLGREIKKTGNSIVIEGHTDSTPFSSSSMKTNWDLSTGRAHTARLVFAQAGVPEGKLLEVRGFADRQLYNPLDPEDSRNRRVSITLLSEETLEARQVIPEETVIPWLTK